MKPLRKRLLTLLAALMTSRPCSGATGTDYILSQNRQERQPTGMQLCGKQLFSTLSKRHLQIKPRFPRLNKRIVGGRVGVDGAWPWQVALFLDGSQVCGGSLINGIWILTACHCFTDYRSSKDPTRWKVKLGSHHIASKVTRFEQVREINEIILHPKYNGKTENGVLVQPPGYDIALLQLSSPVRFNNHVLPICLAPKDMVFAHGKTCYITGWGTTGWNKPQSKLLTQAAINLVSREECNKRKSYNGTVPHTALCAGFPDGRIDACQKDSGGPLACEHDGRWYLVGVISWGKRCAQPNKYGVYADVRVLHEWIANTVEHKRD